MRNQRGYTLTGLLFVGVWLLLIGGWVSNLVKLFGSLDGAVTAMFIARIVGVVVAPLGSLLGYF